MSAHPVFGQASEREGYKMVPSSNYLKTRTSDVDCFHFHLLCSCMT